MVHQSWEWREGGHRPWAVGKKYWTDWEDCDIGRMSLS